MNDNKERVSNAAEFLIYQFGGDGETAPKISQNLAEYAVAEVQKILSGAARFSDERVYAP